MNGMTMQSSRVKTFALFSYGILGCSPSVYRPEKFECTLGGHYIIIKDLPLDIILEFYQHYRTTDKLSANIEFQNCGCVGWDFRFQWRNNEVEMRFRAFQW